VSNVNSIIGPAIVGKVCISILKLHDFIDVVYLNSNATFLWCDTQNTW